MFIMSFRNVKLPELLNIDGPPWLIPPIPGALGPCIGFIPPGPVRYMQ